MKKLKPQETKHLKSKAKPRFKKHPCPIFDDLLKDAIYATKYGQCENYRHYFEANFKNGGKEFDRALAYLNSPLMKALE